LSWSADALALPSARDARRWRNERCLCAPIDVFSAYFYAGENDVALEWLAKAVDTRDLNVYAMGADPHINDRLRNDLRFQQLLRRTKLSG
jgi:hypothetical protein